MSGRMPARTLSALLVLSAGFAAQAQAGVDQDLVVQNVALISPERATPLLRADVIRFPR